MTCRTNTVQTQNKYKSRPNTCKHTQTTANPTHKEPNPKGNSTEQTKTCHEIHTTEKYIQYNNMALPTNIRHYNIGQKFHKTNIHIQRHFKTSIMLTPP